MRLHWKGLRRPALPDDVTAAIAPQPGERLLAWAVKPGTGTTVVAGRHRLYAVATGDGGPHVALSRPWHLVDAGTWSGDEAVLRITWVDGERPARFVLDQPGMLPETLGSVSRRRWCSPSPWTSGSGGRHASSFARTSPRVR